MSVSADMDAHSNEAKADSFGLTMFLHCTVLALHRTVYVLHCNVLHRKVACELTKEQNLTVHPALLKRATSGIGHWIHTTKENRQMLGNYCARTVCGD